MDPSARCHVEDETPSLGRPAHADRPPVTGGGEVVGEQHAQARLTITGAQSPYRNSIVPAMAAQGSGGQAMEARWGRDGMQVAGYTTARQPKKAGEAIVRLEATHHRRQWRRRPAGDVPAPARAIRMA